MTFGDTRTLSPEAQEQIRLRSVHMVLEGATHATVAESMKVSLLSIGRWMATYRSEGWDGLKLRKRGRSKGDGAKLSLKQERRIQSMLVDRTPDQYLLSFALWTRQAVRDLIAKEYQIVLGLTTVGLLLKKWGFTPQRPARRAIEQRPSDVKAWLEQRHPAMAERAKQENAEILWADEAAVKTEAHHLRGFAPQGQTPILRQPARAKHVSLISAIGSRGTMEWMAISETMNSETFIRFLSQLIKHRTRKVFLVVDNLRVHHSRMVKEWVELHKEQIELFYLPSYSPDLNPDEYLNNYLRQNVTKGGVPRDQDSLGVALYSTMRHLGRNPEIVAAFFRHPRVRYAA
jgi:transposase